MTRAHATRCRHRSAAGQAVVEGALVLVLLVVIAASAFGLAVRIVAQIQMESAVANAAASTLAVPLGAGTAGQQAAADAFVGTLQGHAYIDPGTVTCTSAGYFGGGNAATAYTLITCQADAQLRIDRFPFPIGVPIPMHASATVLQPAFRQCDTVATPSGQTCRPG